MRYRGSQRKVRAGRQDTSEALPWNGERNGTHDMRATDTVEIGRTGLRVTRLGLGGVALSGAPPSTDPQRTTPEVEATALIRRSLALGLNYLDTAPMYGVGESERRYSSGPFPPRA